MKKTNKNFVAFLVNALTAGKAKINEEKLSSYGVSKDETIFFVDYDEVVAYCEKPALDLVNEANGTDYTVNDIPCYGHTGNAVIDEKFKAYSDPDFVKSQKLYPGAKEFINELKKRCKVVFLTAVNDNCLTERSKAIQEQFGIDPKDIILANRKDLCVGKFLLDDCSDNIRNSKCEYPILFRRPWNSDVSGAMSVTKYDEVLCFVDYILGQKQERTIPDNPILCFVGPTGSGKTETVEALSKKGFKTIKTYRGVDGEDRRSIGKEEFLKREEEGFFAETSVYGGVKCGISNKDVASIKYNDKVAVVVDIGGAMALKNIFGDRVFIIHCYTPREKAIAKTLERDDLSTDEKVIRISGLEAEYGNSRFADFKLKNLNELLDILKESLK